MKRCFLLLCALCLLLCGCEARDPIQPMAAMEDAAVPAPSGEQLIPREADVVLWFRFGAEPLLAPETRTLALSPTAPFEMTLLQALTGGPAAASTELEGLFPPGTRVTATHRQERTLFVTLSRQIMNDYADEQSGEGLLRRRLAMQAIAATVTENCDVDQVIVLVEQTDSGSDSLRLRQGYYRDGSDATALAAPLLREESVLLTPQRTLETILDCWQTQNWQRLYPWIARTDHADGSARPAFEEFAEHMDAQPALTSWAISGGSVSPDGQSAVFSADFTRLISGQTVDASGILRLHRERGIWRISLSQLTRKEGDLP